VVSSERVQVREGTEDAGMKIRASVAPVPVSDHALGFADQTFFLCHAMPADINMHFSIPRFRPYRPYLFVLDKGTKLLPGTTMRMYA
jgi:hypothetical protein